jgi:hypothetical protein
MRAWGINFCRVVRTASNKTITYEAIDCFGETIITTSMPYHPYNSIFGTYSKFWLKMKRAFYTPGKTRIKTTIKKETSTRFIISLPSGLSLNMAADISKDDLSIIKDWMELLKRSCKK